MIVFPLPDFMKKVGVILAFYRIFGQSFERLNQLMFWENEKNIWKTTVDLRGPLRLPFHFELIKIKDTLGYVFGYRDRSPYILFRVRSLASQRLRTRGADNGPNCCRMSVESIDSNNIVSPLKPQVEKWKLFPNPAKQVLLLEAIGAWESYKVLDTQGKVVLEGGPFSNYLHLTTSLLPNGLYRILAIGKDDAKSSFFQILK